MENYIFIKFAFFFVFDYGYRERRRPRRPTNDTSQTRLSQLKTIRLCLHLCHNEYILKLYKEPPMSNLIGDLHQRPLLEASD